MPIPHLHAYNVDVYSHTLAYHSFTDLLTLLTTNHTLHSSLAHPRTRTAVLHSACSTLPLQRTVLAEWELAEVDVKALLVVLSCVERRLLGGRTIAPLHLSLLIQSLLSSAPSSFAASAQSFISSALSTSSPFLSRFFSSTSTAAYPAAAATRVASSSVSLPSCPALQSLHQPHLSLWLRNPLHSSTFLTEWANQHKPQPPNDTATAADTTHLATLRDTLDSRIVWLGSWRDDRQSLSCFGLYFGTVDRVRDGQHRFDLRQLPYTSVAECQRRMSDASVVWDELPVVSFDLAWSTADAALASGSMPPLLYFPSLTAFLLSVSTFATPNAGEGLRRLLCETHTQQQSEDEEDVLERLECCGKSWRWWAGCLLGECGRHMLPVE